MIPTWQTILAALIWLQAPGQSTYSTVPTAEGSAPSILAEVNGTKAYRLLRPGEPEPNQCKQRGNVACYKPRLRGVVYNLRNLDTQWQRAETYDEGIRRYATIAKAIRQVLGEADLIFPPELRWRFLVTIAYHESGFRRDIHIGRGAWAIGDCKWRKVNGPAGRERIKGTCRSHGLFQSLFHDPKRTELFGVRAAEVIGDDIESTKRAARVAAKHLDRLHRYCRSVGPRPYPNCVLASYGGLSDTRDKRVLSRVGTYNRLAQAPSEPDKYACGVLGIDSESPVVAAR